MTNRTEIQARIDEIGADIENLDELIAPLELSEDRDDFAKRTDLQEDRADLEAELQTLIDQLNQLLKPKRWQSLLFPIENEADCIKYIDSLIERALAYHFDDNPKECNFPLAFTTEQLDQLEQNHTKLWAHCNPWLLLEKDAALWARYSGND